MAQSSEMEISSLSSKMNHNVVFITAEETAAHCPASLVVAHVPATPSQMAGGVDTQVVTHTTATPSHQVPDVADSQLFLPNLPPAASDVFRRIHDGSVATDSPGGNNIGIFSGGGIGEAEADLKVLSPMQNRKSNFFSVQIQNGDLDSPLVPTPECGRVFSESKGLGSASEGVSYSQECTEYTEDIDHCFGYKEGKHWERGELLGRGISGSCYVATDIRSKTVMVVKQISVDEVTCNDDIMSEVDVMQQIRHSNIVQFYGASRDHHHLNIFMELMEGGSLEDRLRCGVFGEERICHYSRQLVSGVSYLHRRGVAHRDLKGANILTDVLGHSLRISDFGAAARLTECHKFYKVAGTPAFIAPEVIRATPYGLKCDVWSMGCVAIEMATASPPWVLPGHHNHRWEILYRIGKSDQPPPIPQFHREELRDFVLKCLRISPEERPSSADLLQHQLMHVHTPTS